jgi:hypothetical protein
MCRIGIASAHPLWSVVICLAQSHSGLPPRLLAIRVEVNNASGLFPVDTGSDCTIIDSEFAQCLELKPSWTALVERNYLNEERITATLDSVRIGARSWSSVPLVVLDLAALSRVQAGTVSGILKMKMPYSTGGPEVVDDIEQGGLPVAMHRVRSRYFADPGEFVFVVEVWKDSPAETAAVLVGDRVLSVNGRASTAAGTPIDLEVEGPSGTSTSRMKTRQLVCESGAGTP